MKALQKTKVLQVPPPPHPLCNTVLHSEGKSGLKMLQVKALHGAKVLQRTKVLQVVRYSSIHPRWEA